MNTGLIVLFVVLGICLLIGLPVASVRINQACDAR